MRLLMGITKGRHGTVYYAIKRVPAPLQEAVARVLNNGKSRQAWLKRSLATRDPEEANKRAKAVQIEFDRTLERAKALIAERPPRTSLSAVEIKRMAEYHYAGKLAAHDELLRIAPEEERALRKLDPEIVWDEPVPAFGLAPNQIADANEAIPAVLQEAETALAQGNIGHIPIQIDDGGAACAWRLRPAASFCCGWRLGRGAIGDGVAHSSGSARTEPDLRSGLSGTAAHSTNFFSSHLCCVGRPKSCTPPNCLNSQTRLPMVERS